MDDEPLGHEVPRPLHLDVPGRDDRAGLAYVDPTDVDRRRELDARAPDATVVDQPSICLLLCAAPQPGRDVVHEPLVAGEAQPVGAPAPRLIAEDLHLALVAVLGVAPRRDAE